MRRTAPPRRRPPAPGRRERAAAWEPQPAAGLVGGRRGHLCADEIGQRDDGPHPERTGVTAREPRLIVVVEPRPFARVAVDVA